MLPLSKNPPARFPNRPINDATTPWWIAKVKPRQEKALAFDLLKTNVEYYLPMYTKVTRRPDNNKPRKSIMCLFPGYLSFCAEKGFEQDIFRTNRVVNIIEIKSQKRFINELEQIYHTFDLGISLTPIDITGPLIIGENVKVVSGPMRGVQGTIVKIQSKHKLILSVEVLGKAAVTIDASLVEPI